MVAFTKEILNGKLHFLYSTFCQVQSWVKKLVAVSLSVLGLEQTYIARGVTENLEIYKTLP